jgi:16S rRNA G966 N2-methylase RsmD
MCHVNLHEAVGLILAGRAALSLEANGRDAPQVMLVDNTVVVGAATKGRSSSSRLNALLRRWAGFLISQG